MWRLGTISLAVTSFWQACGQSDLGCNLQKAELAYKRWKLLRRRFLPGGVWWSAYPWVVLLCELRNSPNSPSERVCNAEDVSGVPEDMVYLHWESKEAKDKKYVFSQHWPLFVVSPASVELIFFFPSIEGKVPALLFEASSRMVRQFLPWSGLSQHFWEDQTSVFQAGFSLVFSIVHLGVLWEGRLWGWARVAPCELAWTPKELFQKWPGSVSACPWLTHQPTDISTTVTIHLCYFWVGDFLRWIQSCSGIASQICSHLWLP